MEKTLQDFIPLQEGINDPGIFKAIFLAGGPGSGKSFIVGKTALPALGLKVINSDQAFELALKKANVPLDPTSIFSDKGQTIRARAKALTQKRMDLALQGRLGVVIDGTGKNYQKIHAQKQALDALGYDTMLLFVNTDLETAQQRNQARARTLPDSQVHKMWQDVQNNIGKFQNSFGHNMLIVDNSSGVNVDATTLSAYRKVSAFIRKPPQNYIAQRWMKNQKNKQIQESLKNWFSKSHPKGDWVRVGTDGEIKGACAREPGEGKPKCMPRQKAHKMDKEDRAKSARRKRRKDPETDRPGTGNKPINVKTEDALTEKGLWDNIRAKRARGEKPAKKGDKDYPTELEKIRKNEEMVPLEKLSKLKPVKSPQQKALTKSREKHKVFKNISIDEAIELLEKNKPTNPALWSRAKAAARSKFDVYPSAYANGWAVQWYKKRGGGWKTVKEVTDLEEVAIPMKDKVLAKTVYKQKYDVAAKTLKDLLTRKRKEGGGKLRHDPVYYANEIKRTTRGLDKLNTRLIAQMTEELIAEEYKYEWGTPEGTAYMKAVTPGEPGKTTKKNKNSSKNHYKAVKIEEVEEVSEALPPHLQKIIGKDGNIDSKKVSKHVYDGKKTKSSAKVTDVTPKGYGPKEEVEIEEKMDMAKADMGDVIKDFQKSDAPQFKGKSKKKKREMAIAAKLGAETQSEMYKSPSHARLQKFMNKNRKSFAYQNKVRSMGGTPLKPGETNKLVPTKENVAEENGVECQDGHYYCRQRKACVPIPDGYKDRGDGFIVKESVLDAEFLQYIHQVEIHGFSETDVQEMERDIDQMSFDDFIKLDMYDEDELESVDIDSDGDYDIYDDVEITEALSIQGRMKRRFNARRNRQKLKVARMRRSRMASDPGRIKKRAARGARNMMKKRLARGRDISSMPPAEKNRLETLVQRFQPIVSKLAQRMVPQIRRAEVSRLAKRGGMKSQKAKKFVVKKAGSASKYKAKKFKIKKK